MQGGTAVSSICLVAGGTGLAPILGMLRRLAASGDTRHVHTVYGANTLAELVCWDELRTLTGQLPGAQLMVVLAAPAPGWSGGRGFVTDALATMLPAIADASVYLAGPPVMTDAVRALLAQHGIQLDRIHYDSFG